MPFSSLSFMKNGLDLTSFFSIAYCALFLPLCLILYSVTPKRGKKYFLLLASYLFFWLISGKLIVYLILTTFSMHYFGLWLDRIQNQMQAEVKNVEKEERKTVKQKFIHRQRLVLLLAVLLHIGILGVLKYSEFFALNINSVFSALKLSLKIEIPRYIMPIGISFFTMQALSYILDVYRGVTKADENLFRVGLFISFFPQIVEGPICRYQQTADQLWNAGAIRYENLTHGIQRILYGMMKKIVVADRLNPMVNYIFGNYTEMNGGLVLVGAIGYTIQLYMDFSGSMDAVMGTAQIFGVRMPENFARPFFSKTISEFWQRWHITLGTWFKDYIFYPVTTAKPMKKITSAARRKIGNHYGPLLAGGIALFCVWLCNGLWHGAAWKFIFFGMYHFALILGGNLMAPIVRSINTKLKINAKSVPYRVLQIVRTSILVVFGELIFRADGVRGGIVMFRSLLTNFTWKPLNDKILVTMGVDWLDLFIVTVTLIIVFIVSLINEKGICIREKLAEKNIVLRWGLLYALILFIIIFGAYGVGYIPVDPMYANF